jgi:hypothetical protein
VLAGIEGLVGGDPVDRQERAVQQTYAFVEAVRAASAGVGASEAGRPVTSAA